MRPIATNDPVAWCVSFFVCHAAALCKTAERIEVMFSVEIFRGPRYVMSDGGPDPLTAREVDAAFLKVLLLFSSLLCLCLSVFGL